VTPVSPARPFGFFSFPSVPAPLFFLNPFFLFYSILTGHRFSPSDDPVFFLLVRCATRPPFFFQPITDLASVSGCSLYSGSSTRESHPFCSSLAPPFRLPRTPFFLPSPPPPIRGFLVFSFKLSCFPFSRVSVRLFCVKPASLSFSNFRVVSFGLRVLFPFSFPLPS